MDGATTETETREAEAPPRRHRRGWPVFTVLAVAIIAFLVGGFGGSYQGKLSEVQQNDNAAFLPGSAESTRASNEADKFIPVRDLPGFVVFHRESGLTEQDRSAIANAQRAVAGVAGVDANAVLPPQFSDDGTTAALFAPLIGKQNGVEVSGDELSTTEQNVIAAARDAVSESAGLEVYPAGPGGLLVAFIDSFEGLDGALLGAALGVVILILLVV